MILPFLEYLINSMICSIGPCRWPLPNTSWFSKEESALAQHILGKGKQYRPMEQIMEMIKYALPGNRSVNTVQHATTKEAVFSILLSTPCPVLLRDQSTCSLTCDTCILCGLRHATIEGLCFLCVVRAERIWENMGLGIDFTWVPKFQGNSSVARRRIRRLSMWHYMCCSISI
jgi:hypothetical protein